MSRYTEHDDVLVADPEGDMSYEEAVSATVDNVVNAFEELIWNLVDDVEYLQEQEAEDPTDNDTENEPEVE
mgnify:CR=1 FL=1